MRLYDIDGFKIGEDVEHHGIKGQKWGVRRYQNSDGSLTPEGEDRYRARRRIIEGLKTMDDVNDIVSTLSESDKKLLGASLNEKWVEDRTQMSTLLKTFVAKHGDTPVAFIQAWVDDSKNTAEIAVASRNDPDYRGKGYADEVTKKMVEWMDRYGHKTLDELYWSYERENIKSEKLGKKYGFIEVSEKEYPYSKEYLKTYGVLKYRKRAE